MGELDALPELYGRVLVPEPVLRELEAGAQLDDTARRLRTVTGIEVYVLATGFRRSWLASWISAKRR